MMLARPFVALFVFSVAACGAASSEPPAAPTSSEAAPPVSTSPAPKASAASTSPAPRASAAPSTSSSPASNACVAAGGQCLSLTSPIMIACANPAPPGCASGEFCCVTGKAPKP